MILETMLQRLYASLASGPGLNARPHRSRQRIDLTDLSAFQGTDPQQVLTAFLRSQPRPLDFPATVPIPPEAAPGGPPDPAAHRLREDWDRQQKLLRKLRSIAQDATDYHHDHGDHPLFLGFPLLSVPVASGRGGSRRLLAPAALMPIHLKVRQGPRAGVTLSPAADGGDLLIANPALMAWIEQQTGEDTDHVFADDEGNDPWREISEVLELTCRTLGVQADQVGFDSEHQTLESVPLTADLPREAAVIPGAVLGLFPSANPGLIRDTKWMIANEPRLQAPVRGFLKLESLKEPTALDRTNQSAPSTPTVPPEDEWLVTRADPCQAQSVVQARTSEALVVHGPPGTGKSQTIANIIGDHLARGQRVLFVCDKRTALDVVQFRLESMGLGNLCGVIHDPQRDRRDFYMALRDRLEQLSREQPIANADAELQTHNERLASLNEELRGYYRSLHEPTARGEPSFHDLCGQWLALQADPEIGGSKIDVEGLSLADIERHQADADEVLNRAAAASWPRNPLRGQVKPRLNEWFAGRRETIEQAMVEVRFAAVTLDECGDPELTLDPDLPPLAQAESCERAAALINDLGASGLEVANRLIDDHRADHWRRECDSLAAEAALLAGPLEAELRLNHDLRAHPPTPAHLRQHLATIDHWLGLNGLQRLLYFGARRATRAALGEIGLSQMNQSSLQRARSHYDGLLARVLWTDLHQRMTGAGTPTTGPVLDDRPLLAFHRAVPLALELRHQLEQPASGPWGLEVRALLAEPGSADEPDATARRLLQRARRARALAGLGSALEATGLLTGESIRSWRIRWSGESSATTDVDAMIAALPSVESLIRIEERLATLPDPLASTLRQAADAGWSWSEAEKQARFHVLHQLLRTRLLTEPELSRIDTQRIESAFDELQRRIEGKQELVRRAIRHRWDQLWRQRLLAGTGSRLNSVGANLRQRLFVRGKRALKLRQMIAVGEDHPDGDPVFDLCPVWMASPATVAQIFPRTPRFDTVIFDEASQCRLEEAMPTLLRAKRVVIAGDPKQLPPTRFFEGALADSDDTEAETPEELFEVQQAGAEDLLAASLNLNVDQTFLDVHYRSRNPALIEFSNHAFYGSRLQSVPGHPSRLDRAAPIRLIRVDGTYRDRTNPAEAAQAARLVAELLASDQPPSIGIASFNLTQRECILDALDQLSAEDEEFAKRLEHARQRQGEDSFEGLFVKNLENVQGDQRDHMIISTTFGPDDEGKFRRNFGALSQRGGERRLNVLITRAREAIHLLTSIPESEYLTAMPAVSGDNVSGRHYLFDYLRFAANLQRTASAPAPAASSAPPRASAIEQQPTGTPSPFAEAFAHWLERSAGLGGTLYWGNDGFCIDLALPAVPGQDDIDASHPLGLLADFNRYRKTPDPIAWENFRTAILRAQGWQLHRLWSPTLFRDPARTIRQTLGSTAVPALFIGAEVTDATVLGGDGF